MNQTTENHATQTIKLDRKLPPHELNARRARKRSVTQLPAIASLPSTGVHPSVESGLAPDEKTNF